jgi:hypothetical protein
MTEKNEVLPSGTWGLKSPWAKRLFLVGLAALAARQESGSNSPENCLSLAAIFGGEDDFQFFLWQRTDTGTLIKSMNTWTNEQLAAVADDALRFEDPNGITILNGVVKEAKRRKLSLPKPSKQLKRKFSFDD